MDQLITSIYESNKDLNNEKYCCCWFSMGDEEGKIVDWLSEQADIVVRFKVVIMLSTLVIDGVTYKLRLLPSGIVRKNKISVIGNGVVIDPWALLEEIKEIKLKGVEVSEEKFNNL